MKKGTVAFLSMIAGGITGALGGTVNVYRREHKKLKMEEKNTLTIYLSMKYNIT